MHSEYQHLIDLNDFPVAWWKKLIELGENIKNDPVKYAHECEGKVMATLFYEPSTRTQMSFQTAMLRLGGRIIGFDNPANSSVAKGETIKDTTKIVSSYADILVIRHPVAGAAKAASLTADCPVINAGDGGHNHPTQTLADLLTIWRKKKTFENLTIGLCGDLKFGRTVHSLVVAMARYAGVKFIFISPEELRIPRYILTDTLDPAGIPYEEVSSMEEAMPRLDVLYMTRVQRERFFNEADYIRLKDTYILTPDKLSNAREDLVIMHPLPRVNEISVAVDDDPRACYFEQVKNGKYMRMALILKLLEVNV